MKDSGHPEHWRQLRRACEMTLVDRGKRGAERLGRSAEARLARALEAEDLGSFCEITVKQSL